MKLALLSALADNKGAVYQIVADQPYSFTEIISDHFDFETIKGESVTAYWRNRNNTDSTVINDVEDCVASNGDYFTRIERIQKGLLESKEESRQEIEKYEKKINGLHAYPIREMIAEFGTDFLDETVRENDLLVFLLRHGYLDENYENYIYYFHPNSINKEEMNFILGVRNHRTKTEYTYALKNVAQVFGRLETFEFQQPEILNYDLADYLLENKIDTKSASVFFEQLSNHSKGSMDFIKAYVERGNNIEVFIHRLCRENVLFWKDITEDDGISLDTRYNYLVMMIKYADIKDVVAQDRVVTMKAGDGEREADGVLTEFLLSNAEVLQKMKEAPVDRQIALIEGLGIRFSNADLTGVDEAIQKKIFDDCHYELNEIMIKQLFIWKAPERVKDLKKKHYTSIRNLGYQPLIDYVQYSDWSSENDNFVNYILNLVLGIETNVNEEVDALEDIIEHLMPDQDDLCFEVLENEKAVWEDIKYCCSGMNDPDDQSKKAVWDFLVENDRIRCTWDNFIAYFEQFGSGKVWEEYFERNIDVLLKDTSDPVITEEVVSALLYADMSEDNFRKYMSHMEMKPYEGALDKLNPMKITVMIEKGNLPFTIVFWEEMYDAAPELRVYYAEENSNLFLESIEEIEMSSEEINKLLQSARFDPAAKRKILSKVDSKMLEMDTAKVIRNLNFKIDRSYTDAAWKLLEKDDKYELLLNQIDSYKNEELPDMFSELDPMYHQLVERTRHQYKLTYNDYNKKLLEKLRKKIYITSKEERWIDKEHLIVGYVKQVQ